jgi:hypothetical protein
VRMGMRDEGGVEDWGNGDGLVGNSVDDLLREERDWWHVGKGIEESKGSRREGKELFREERRDGRMRCYSCHVSITV